MLCDNHPDSIENLQINLFMIVMTYEYEIIFFKKLESFYETCSINIIGQKGRI